MRRPGVGARRADRFGGVLGSVGVDVLGSSKAAEGPPTAEQNGVELSAGDFVRWCRQVLDLLDQIADVAGRDTPVGRAAAAAAKSVRRGVVAAGTA